MTHLPSEKCFYCGRLKEPDGSTYHEADCEGLKAVTLSQLQFDALVKPEGLSNERVLVPSKEVSIVEYLRKLHEEGEDCAWNNLLARAADEIDRQAAEIESLKRDCEEKDDLSDQLLATSVRLRAALTEIARLTRPRGEIEHIARAALARESGQNDG